MSSAKDTMLKKIYASRLKSTPPNFKEITTLIRDTKATSNNLSNQTGTKHLVKGYLRRVNAGESITADSFSGSYSQLIAVKLFIYDLIDDELFKPKSNILVTMNGGNVHNILVSEIRMLDDTSSIYFAQGGIFPAAKAKP